MPKKSYLSIYAKSFNWAGFFLPKETYRKCSALYDFCRVADNIADNDDLLENKEKKFEIFENNFKQKNLKFEFSTSNGRGREVEYYSSLIFSIDIKIKNKQKTFISGGRFNDLTSKTFGLRKIPAVGCAINLGVYE